MNKQEKAAEVEHLTGFLKDGPHAFVLAPKGLTVNQVSTLRRRIRAGSGRYRVVKNRLALRALKGSALEPLSPHFKGETAIAFSGADPAVLAKAIEEFSRENQGLKVKAGFVDGRVVGVEEVKLLAAMPPRPLLIARFLMALNQPMTRMVTVLKGTHRGLVKAMHEIANKKKESGPAAPAGSETPAS